MLIIIITIQETIGDGARISCEFSKLLVDWDFIFVDSIGRLGVLLLGGGKHLQ